MTSMKRSSVLPRESKINANTTDHLSDLEVLGDFLRLVEIVARCRGKAQRVRNFFLWKAPAS
jgi:hypothetical protein